MPQGTSVNNAMNFNTTGGGGGRMEHFDMAGVEVAEPNSNLSEFFH